MPFSRDPHSEIEPRSPALLVDSLPSEPPGKPQRLLTSGNYFLTTFSAHISEEKKREVAQSCPTLCDPKDCSPLGSSVHGIF